MKQVRAKLECTSIESFKESKVAKFQAVIAYIGLSENTDFTKYTPSGRLEITITNNVPASDFFEVGEEYYLDFTNARPIKDNN